MNAELGKDVQSLESPTGKYALFYSKEEKAEGQSVVKFMVVDNTKEALIFEDALLNANLSWHSDTELLVEQQSGILQNDSTVNNGMQQFLLNPVSGKKKPLPQHTNSY